ncbi:hypothetical protein HID58_038495 [Brassica napus]|uniref:Uncharacterized protein n=1 Tax=Brassica napus TaxID=3708 RepID=A0ABQ8BQL2_BRANA|nr:hypothetical protein HID58_038495 [Brassica napus]
MATLPFAVALLDGTATALSISPRRHGDGSIICGSRRGKKTATFLSVPLLDQAKRRHLYRWIDQKRDRLCLCGFRCVIKHHTGSSDRGPSIIHTDYGWHRSREWTVLAMTGHGSGQVRGVDHWLPVGEVRGVCSLLSV